MGLADGFGLAAGIVGIAGYAPYVRDILKGAAKPEKASWLIWALEYAMLFIAQVAKGAAASLWLIGLQLLGVVVIYCLALRYGIGGFGRGKQLLLGCVFLAMVAWLVSDDAALTILILLAVEATGVALTAIKAYRQPESETLTIWIMIGCGGLLTLPAIGYGKDPILYLYPVSLMLVNLCVVGAVLLGRRNQETPADDILGDLLSDVDLDDLLRGGHKKTVLAYNTWDKSDNGLITDITPQ